MRPVKRWLDYLYDAFFLFTIMEVLYIIANNLVPVFPLVLVAVINGIALLWISGKKELPVPFILFLILLSVLAGFFTGLNVYAGILWTVVICWRAYIHFIKVDIDHENQHALFLVSLALCLFVYLVLSGYEHKSILIVLPVVQLFYLIFLKIFDMLLSQGAVTDSTTRKYAIWGMGTIGSSVILSVLAIVLFPAIKAFVTTAFSWIASALGFIFIRPIVWFLNAIIGERDAKQDEGDPVEPPVDTDKMPEKMEKTSSVFDNELLFLAIISIVLIALAVYFFRKKIKVNLSKLNPEVVTSNVTKSTTKRRVKRIKPPKDTVRKRFYQLQKTLSKKGFARSSHESVEDWFQRIELESPDKAMIASDYRKVRYGGKTLSKSEMERYEKGIKELIEEAKEHNKGK